MAPSPASFNEIPQLDLSLADDPQARPALLGQLRHALTDVGFLYVVRHGVPDAVVHDMIDILPRLFRLPDEAKEEVALFNSPHFLGYSTSGSEMTAGKRDHREQFEFATELPETWSTANGLPLADRLRGPNQVIMSTPFFSLSPHLPADNIM